MNLPLSKVRREHYLQLNDVAFLLEIDSGNLSKYESGKMPVPLLVQLGYHLLFDIEFAQRSILDRAEFAQRICNRAKVLETRFLTQQITRKRLYRVKSIQRIINRLNTELEHE